MMITYITHLSQSKITVSAHWKSETIDKVREIGQYIYEDKWVWNCTNEDFADLKIEDLNIENLDYFTPPQMSGWGVIIPEYFAWVFKDDKFILGDFVVNFNRVNGQLVVDTAYLQWQAFQDELNAPHNDAVVKSLEDIWEYVEKQAEANNYIKIK